MSDAERPASIWAQEFDDLLRGMSGALLFGIPLLYTMEVWWIGDYTSPVRMFAGLMITYLALIGLNRTIGFRQQRGGSLWHTLTDSIEALAIGLLVATLSLILLRRITIDMSFNAIMGRIILEGIPFGLGVGIAGATLGNTDDDDDDGDSDADDDANAADSAADDESDSAERDRESPWSIKATLADAGSTALGAIIIAFSIAPTEEVPMIAINLTPPWLLAVVIVSLLASYMIVFEANFGTQQSRMQQRGLFQRPISETLVSYLIALVLAMLMLMFFQLLRPEDPWNQWVSYSIILALPASVGGAAGRLAL